MILWLICIFVVLTFMSWLLISNKTLKWGLGAITTLILCSLMILLSANMLSHFGMKKVSTVTYSEVNSILPQQSPVKAVAVKKIGKDNFVLIYKDNASDLKPAVHFVPNKKDIVSSIKQSSTFRKGNADKAYVKTTTVTWKYKSKFMKTIFNVGNEKKENLVSKKNVLEVPKSWQIIEK